MKELSIFFLCPLILICTSSVSAQIDAVLFNGFRTSGVNLTLTGSAQILEDGVLQLTSNDRRLIGHAFFYEQFRFKSSPNGSALSFSTSFAFAIIPEYQSLGGHGFAFTISRSRDMSGALPSQFLGLLNASNVGNFSNHLFAVEFNTAQDFDFQDINDNHLGIDINNLKSSAAVTSAYYDDDSVKQVVNLTSGDRIQAWIDYDSVTKIINVTISPRRKKPSVPILSYKSDLSQILHEYMYAGFSASTGVLASSHYVLGWSFKINNVDAPPLDLSSLPPIPGPKKKHTGLVIGISVFSVGVAALLLIVAMRLRNADVIEAWELDIAPNRFSYSEMKRATGGFKEKKLLGRGGFGEVYRGTLADSKTQIAVKRVARDSKQGLRESASEINIIGRLRHRNLVRLLGWCRRRSDLLLVYEYMENGSLDNFLFDESKPVLSWNRRFRIIKDVACGLLYLHEGYEQVVIHRDIKPSNVLLDGQMNSRLGDFGLARLYDRGSNPNTTKVVGTLGYLAPELPRTGRWTASCDVFSFGILVLEVVSGRRPIEMTGATEELVLVDWANTKFFSGRSVDVVDLRLKGEFVAEELEMVLKLGLMCSQEIPAERPSMRQAVRYLAGEVALPEMFDAVSRRLWSPADAGGPALDGHAGSSSSSPCASPLPLLRHRDPILAGEDV